MNAYFHEENNKTGNNPPPANPFDKLQPKKSDWTPQPGKLPVFDDTIKKDKHAKELCQAEAERQLSDGSSYDLLNKDPSSDHSDTSIAHT